MESQVSIKTSSLGDCFLIYVLLFYDYPRIFICKSNIGKFFLFSESETGPDFCEWAVAEISSNQISELNKGHILLSSIFKNGNLYLVKRRRDNNICESVNVDSIASDKLPDIDNSISGFIDDVHEQIALDLANNTSKPVVSVAINNCDNDYPFAPLSLIKSFGDTIKRTASSICPFYTDEDLQVSLAKASTVINFAISNPIKWQGKLLQKDDKDPSQMIVETISRMNSAKTLDELRNASDNNPATIRAYKAFVHCFALVSKKNDVSSIIATPGSKSTMLTEFSKETISSRLELIELAEKQSNDIEKKDFGVAGVLVGLLSKDNKRFQFCPEKGGFPFKLPDLIKGSVEDSVFAGSKEFVLNVGRYFAEITRITDQSLPRSKVQYILTSLKPLPSTTNH